jgi:uncharacterized protein (DUF1800 family)
MRGPHSRHQKQLVSLTHAYVFVSLDPATRDALRPRTFNIYGRRLIVAAALHCVRAFYGQEIYKLQFMVDLAICIMLVVVSKYSKVPF